VLSLFSISGIDFAHKIGARPPQLLFTRLPLRSPEDYDLVVCVAPLQVTLSSRLVYDRFQAHTDSSLRGGQSSTTVRTCRQSALACAPDKIRNSLPWRSFQKKQLACLDEISRLHPVEVYAALRIDPAAILKGDIPCKHQND